MASDIDRGRLSWFTPEALVELGVRRSRVVIVNEAHDGDLHCRRTRLIGRRLLPVAHRGGVRHLAMEVLPNSGRLREWTAEANRSRAVPPPPVAAGYLAQADMRALIQDALDLGWTLLAYECDFDRELPALAHRPPGDHETIAWREQEEAQNLAGHVTALPSHGKVLVWCGWDHLAKTPLDGLTWMACRFWQLTGVEPFCIDQTISVHPGPAVVDLLPALTPELAARGGTAGLLAHDLAMLPNLAERAARADAFLFSLDNRLE